MNGSTNTPCVCVRPAERRRPRPDPRSRGTARLRRVCNRTHDSSPPGSSQTPILYYTINYQLNRLQRTEGRIDTGLLPTPWREVAHRG